MTRMKAKPQQLKRGPGRPAATGNKFVMPTVRFETKMYRELRAAAEENARTLNGEVNFRLRKSLQAAE